MSDGCPVLATNHPACECAEGECEVFDEFGMACDNCDVAGHREADGWVLNRDGSVWCVSCAADANQVPPTNSEEWQPIGAAGKKSIDVILPMPGTGHGHSYSRIAPNQHTCFHRAAAAES
jgi:hypothetical protein